MLPWDSHCEGQRHQSIPNQPLGHRWSDGTLLGVISCQPYPAAVMRRMRATVREGKGESSPWGTDHILGQCQALANSAGRGAPQAALVASSLHHTVARGEGMGHKTP